jgi:hypothetical protein
VTPCDTEKLTVSQKKINEINGVTPVTPVTPKNHHFPNTKEPQAALVGGVPGADQSCATCAHMGPVKTCFDPVAAGLSNRFELFFVELLGSHGATCKAFRGGTKGQNKGVRHGVGVTLGVTKNTPTGKIVINQQLA